MNPSTPARIGIAAGFVAIWMLGGVLAGLSVNAYLLLGVPLVLLFQRFVARAPLRALWVRDAPPLAFGARDWTITAVFAIMPAFDLVRSMAGNADAIIVAWDLCALAGALGVAYALKSWHREALRAALGFAALALACGIFTMAGAAWTTGRSPWIALARLPGFAEDLLLYLPVSFVIEEVAFRGALDRYVGGSGFTGNRAFATAAISGALWGLWHWPIVPEPLHAAVVVQLLAVHVPIGVFLALSWRAGGTLFLPALAHALVDAYRNAVLG
jgi:Type II CAAX prenyl endopeptidase Rce1-like